MLVNIVTPCTRPENLLAIQESINNHANFKYRWHIIFENLKLDNRPDRIYIDHLKKKLNNNNKYYWATSNGIAGHTHRNFIIDKLSGETGWLYFNDDDNILHPDFSKINFEETGYSAIVLSQKDSDGTNRVYDGNTLIASPHNMKVRRIDTAQLIFNLYSLKDLYFDDRYYWADGIFAEKFNEKNTNIKYLKDLFCYYNYLSV